MMNPTTVTFNMENREVIEGFKSVRDIDNTNLSFEPCLTVPAKELQIELPKLIEQVIPEVIGTPISATSVRRPTLVGRPRTPEVISIKSTSQRQPVISPPVQRQPVVVPLVQRQPVVQRRPVLPSLPSAKSIVAPLIPVEEIITSSIESEAIPVTIKEFQPPLVVGVPTINNDPTEYEPPINVVTKRYVEVLNCRTYLAR